MKSTRTARNFICVVLSLLVLSSTGAVAQELPSHGELVDALQRVVADDNGGFGFHMWATVVDRDGVVRAVVFSGDERGDQWPGSRLISAQKAYTANAFSLPDFALSTANLYSAVQPGASLYGLQHGNPVDAAGAYAGDPGAVGTEDDPMVDEKIGGINVFGGGLPLYSGDGTLVGALGVSGDSSCADHNIAWKLRSMLELDHVPGGVSSAGDDNIVYDLSAGTSEGGWGHPECSQEATAIAEEFPTTHPVR